MTKYVLPDLPYDYGALEPHISARIMQLHHDKHHKGYVDGANQALEKLEEARSKGDFAAIAAVEQRSGVQSLRPRAAQHFLAEHEAGWRRRAHG